MEKNGLKIGDRAPEFTLVDQNENKISLKDFKGKWVVLYFYPKDSTPGCTREAIGFTEHLKDYQKLNAVIFGVSPDSAKSHCNFIEKEGLKITLLCDPDHKALKNYSAWGLKKNYGKEYMGVIRSTFLIDPKGNIAAVWSSVKVDGHVEAVKEKLKELTQA
jgi:peroxiredoxin Q/BCP